MHATTITRPEDACCPAMAQARSDNSDSEAWGPLITDEGGEFTMGCGLPPVRVCPWCGAGVSTEEDLGA